MVRKFIILLISVLFISSLVRAEVTPGTKKSMSLGNSITEIKLGESTVQLEVIRRGRGPVFVALHENESTAITAAKKLLSKSGGTLIILRHGGDRNVTFALSGVMYNFDPNRIFTIEGIRRTLKGGSSREAITAVRSLAQVILSEIGNRPIIALHNNTNGGYSLASYVSGGKYARDALLVHRESVQDIDNFFFTTEKRLFVAAKQKKFNVVLQSGIAADDGSLSVYSFEHGLRYVNVEAEHGSAVTQFIMLTWLSHNW